MEWGTAMSDPKMHHVAMAFNRVADRESGLCYPWSLKDGAAHWRRGEAAAECMRQVVDDAHLVGPEEILMAPLPTDFMVDGDLEAGVAACLGVEPGRLTFLVGVDGGLVCRVSPRSAAMKCSDLDERAVLSLAFHTHTDKKHLGAGRQMERLGIPGKLAYRKLEKLEARGWLDAGVSLMTPWLTTEGEARLTELGGPLDHGEACALLVGPDGCGDE